jgi:3-oxoadipate enol-lactonase
MFLDLDGMTAYVLEDGPSDGAPVVFVNSLGSDLRIWDDVVPTVALRYRCIRYDKRGHGLSEDVAPYDLETQTEDFLALLEARGARHATVVGISVGGLIAMSAALAQPEQIGALVLCDTAARIGSVDGWKERIEWVEAEGLAAAAPSIVERWFAPDFGAQRPTDLRGYTTMLARTSQRGYVGTCGLLREADLRGRIGSITCPTLVVTGAHDLATPPDVGEALADAIPGARFAQIDGAGHLPCLETPEALSRLIQEVQEEATRD